MFTFSILLILILDFFVPIPEDNEWKWLRDILYCYDSARYYFQPNIQIRDCSSSIDPNGKYIYATHPHAVFPCGSTLGQEPFHDFHWLQGGASVLFKIPLMRRLLSYIGGFPATRENVLRRMKNSKPGTLFFLAVGGISEMFYGMQDTEDIILNKRRGWLRLALQSGYDGIFPSYALGSNQAYHRFSYFHKGSIFHALSKKFRMSFVPFYGRYFFAPFRVPMCTIVGKMIAIPKNIPSDKIENEVDKLQALYKAELRRIYYKGRKELVQKLSGEWKEFWKNREISFDGETKQHQM